MEDTKKFINDHFTRGYSYNLDSLETGEIIFISDYLNQLKKVKGNLRIKSITKDETKLDIQIEGGLCFFY